jgi:hypothetical protein
MKRETMIWTIVLLIGAVLLALNGAIRGAGRAYVKEVPMRFVNVAEPGEVRPDWIRYDSDAALDEPICIKPFDQIAPDRRISWTRTEKAQRGEYLTAQAINPTDNPYRVSVSRTIGVWVAALFTLFIFSFLYKDNPLYKIAEASVVGVSAAYWMVIGFWDVIVPNLFGKVAPALVRQWAIPGLEDPPNYWYLVPLVLGVMLLWRLSPRGAWIGRWPLAFVIGTTAGIRLIGFLQADFLSQIRNTVIPLVAVEASTGTFDFWASAKNLTIVIGVLAGLVYFFFSIEHKGVVGKTARLGIWFLMVTFGAAFGYTVMGRIALFAIRLEFLFDNWLWLIDPVQRRVPVDPETLAMVLSHPLAVLGLG